MSHGGIEKALAVNQRLMIATSRGFTIGQVRRLAPPTSATSPEAANMRT